MHRAAAEPPKSRPCGTIVGSRKEVADGFVQNAGAHPSRSLPAGIGEIAGSGDTNSQVISTGIIIIQPKVGNGLAVVPVVDSNGRGVGGAGGKGDVGSAAARNSGSHRSDVVGIRAGEQGRKLEDSIDGLVGVENVSVIIYLPRVYAVKIGGTCGSDALALKRGGGAAKNPEGVRGWVILTGIDVNQQLRIRYPPPQRQATATKKKNFRFIRICYLLKNFSVSTLPATTSQARNHKKRKKVKKNRLKNDKNERKAAKIPLFSVAERKFLRARGRVEFDEELVIAACCGRDFFLP